MVVHRVAILALDAVVPLDLSIPAQLFAERDSTPYQMTLCASTPGLVRTTSPFSIHATGGLDDLRRADTVIVPGFNPPLRLPESQMLDGLAEVHARGGRVVSICTGAFALAAAGVLDGLTATTHWRFVDDLAARYPRVLVDRDVLYVDEGTVLTSAGTAAGIDLCLHIIRRDLGTHVANELARDLVVVPNGHGGQARYIPRHLPPETGTSLADIRAWVLEHLDAPLTLGQVAAKATMPQRTLTRRFVTETGMPPLQWIQAARVDRARELLERSDLSIDEIANRCGLGSSANFRQHFRKYTGTSPGEYRKIFTYR